MINYKSVSTTHMSLNEKFKSLNTQNAPGQEIKQGDEDLSSIMIGIQLEGVFVDFSHGDIDAFLPTPGSKELWNQGYDKGGEQAYTEYKGLEEIRSMLADRIGKFTMAPISAKNEMIITPGTQGALFLALGSTVSNGTKVAIVLPDYFANRKLVKFFGGEIVPIPLNYLNHTHNKGIDLDQLEKAFKQGIQVFVFSNPNNPSGYIYTKEEINKIAQLASQYNITVIVDQLYSRMLFSNEEYTHLRSCENLPENLVTIMGPSKTESLSGFRLGVAFGSAAIIDRMESL